MVVCLTLVITNKFIRVAAMISTKIKVLPGTKALKISFLFPVNSVALI